MNLKDQATETVRRLESDIADSFPELLKSYSVSEHVTLTDSVPRYAAYSYVPRSLVELCEAVATTYGEQALEQYHQLVLATLISTFPQRRTGLVIPRSIESLQSQYLQRVLSDLDAPREGFYTFENDRFVKDLAVCRCKLVPCGPELVDTCAGVPRRTLIGQSVRETLKNAGFLLGRLRGFRPIYESHMDRRLVCDRSIEGYNRFYVRLGDLLSSNPQVKGVVLGAAWFMDPALDRISPELTFLRTVPMDHGARLFPTATTEIQTRNATALSPTRRKLFEAGAYAPRCYMLIWARADVLSFRDRMSKKRD